MTVQQGARVRAPEFPAGSWFNTAEPLSLKALRGKLVLLDFWTFCCANCLHVIDELRELEAGYPDELVIIGVHSPKFDHEKSDRAVEAATARYGVAHPVFNDPDLQLWQQYAVRAWPTLVLIDPDGYVVAQAAGEGQASGLRLLIDQLIDRHRDSLRRGDHPYRPPVPQPAALRFPAKAVRTEAGLLVADAGHHQLVLTALDGETVLRRIGSGERGRQDEPIASFAEPNGLALVPAELDLDFDVLVADTGNHLLRGIRLADGTVRRTVDLAGGLAGTRTVTGPVPDVLSPWDVAWWPAIGQFVVAAAGVHLLLGWDPRADRVSILAGTTVEGLRDGPAGEGWLAQPSGLAVDGDRVWFVDSETSALRYLTAAGELHTVVGEGLFDFGHVDGPAATARLQHPLGVALLTDGSVAIADTYNSSIRRYDPVTDELATLADELAEPSGLLLVDGELVVVESAAHRLIRPVTAGRLRQVLGEPLRTARPVTELAAGAVRLRVVFSAPPGRKLDERYGPSSQLTVSASPPELLAAGAGTSTELARTLVLAGTEGVLHISAQAASCDDDPAIEHPACQLARQDWGIPVRLVAEGGDGQLTLMLLG
ncbi:MAG TPA: thioredoxin-like domain-containing protein [Jatrophihabitans sp.]|nr:thioredoxin-like domain-containing protein [Jatrophihabitans sp.]